MRKIEQLIGKRADDDKSDLDEVHVQQLCHLLRGQGGEHGARLAGKLLEPVESESPAVEESKPA